jgi:hypothetical protein
VHDGDTGLGICIRRFEVLLLSSVALSWLAMPLHTVAVEYKHYYILRFVDGELCGVVRREANRRVCAWTCEFEMRRRSVHGVIGREYVCRNRI